MHTRKRNSSQYTRRIVAFTEKKLRNTRDFAGTFRWHFYAGTRQHELARYAGRNPDSSLPGKTSMCLAPTERDLKNLDNYRFWGKTKM